jgi:cell division septum initiation protein DivIVA
MSDDDQAVHPLEDSDHHRGLTGVLDALEQAVVGARAMPMSSSVLVNRAEILDLVQQARSVLPDQLARADEILAGADEVLAAARSEADATVSEAHAEADRLVGSEEVVRRAHVRAEEIVAEADRTADELRREADDYCDRRLADFEIDLGKVLAQVQAGRAKLAGRLDPGGREPATEEGTA